MEISKIYQAPEQIGVSAPSANNQQIGEKAKVADSNVTMQKDFQVNLQDGLKMKLAEFATILQSRGQLIESLPVAIRKAVVELLGQMSADTELPQGLENLFKGQKNASEQLKKLSTILDFSAVLQKDEHSEVKVFLQKTLENFTKQATKTPEQSATELVKLAKQLPVSNAAAQGKLSQALEPFLKSLFPEVGNKGAVAAQLELVVRILPPEISKSLQQVLRQGNIPDSVRGLADAFSNAVVQSENMSSDLQISALKNFEKFIAKYPLMSADNNNVLSQLAKQFTDPNTTVEQLKNLIQQLKTQLFIGDPKLVDKQQHVLDQITKLFEPNLPQALLEGVVKHKLPELPKIWALLTALETEQWQVIESQNLLKSAGIVKELAQSIYKATNLAGEKQAEHSTLSFSVPLYVAEGMCYPAHIHIYHEEKNNNSQLTEREFETWLRVCVDTENIGMVDSVFRLYGDNKLDVRVNFPVKSAAQQFAQDLPDVRKSLENSKLTLTDVIVSKGN